LEAFKQLKKHAVVVYISTKDPKTKNVASPVVIGALNAKSMGNTIPMAVVTSSDQMTYMTSVSYEGMKDSKAFRNANTMVKEALAGTPASKPEDAHDCWTVAKNGGFYTGSFVELESEETLILESPKGKSMRVPMAKLSSGAQSYARALANSEEESTTEELEIESWESAKGGNSISATFISLNDEMITLQKENGKTVTFKLSLLSANSQERAKELAGQ